MAPSQTVTPRETVAPFLGNTTGKTYTYINPISIFHGAELYVNGGNYYYSRQVQVNFLYHEILYNFFKHLVLVQVFFL